MFFLWQYNLEIRSGLVFKSPPSNMHAQLNLVEDVYGILLFYWSFMDFGKRAFMLSIPSELSNVPIRKRLTILFLISFETIALNDTFTKQIGMYPKHIHTELAKSLSVTLENGPLGGELCLNRGTR